jgi:eukaryotic-like serine/threonine-protein kinase
MNYCPSCGKSYGGEKTHCPDCNAVLINASGSLLTPGRILHGKYEIQGLIHSGGMGYIYLARDTTLGGRLCVVKQIKETLGADANLLKQLQNEALNMAKLKHSNVAMVFEHFVEDDYYFLVVEYIPGKTLSEIFAERDGQFPEDEVVEWAVVMCDVVSYMHIQNVLHRDITPDNIILDDEGVIKFVDFGTMRELQYVATRGTAGMGKYGYTPPEQWLGRPLPQSDIFSLGATIYYLLSGFLPLSKAYLTGKGIEGQDFNPEFPPIRQRNPRVSTELEAILQKALQLGVNSRYATAEQFKQALLSTKKEPTARPVLKVDCKRIDIKNAKPGQIITKHFNLKNVGSGNLIGKISSSQPWLEVSPPVIETAKTAEKITMTVNTSGLSPGVSTAGDIYISTNGGRAKVMLAVSTSSLDEMKRKPAVKQAKSWRPIFMYCAIALGLILLTAIILYVIQATTPKLSSPSATAFSNAGKIAFVSRHDGNNEIYTIDTDGSNQKRVTYTDVDELSPKWSPDGTRMAFYCDYGIWTMSADGSNRTKIATCPVDAIPAWSPDGTRIAFHTYTVSTKSRICVVNTDGSNLVYLTGDYGDYYPAWSPDGKKIVFSSSGNGPQGLFVINADGTNEVQITIYNDAWPSWSPDGKKIVFVSWLKQDSNWQLYTVNADGSARTRITDTPQANGGPAWSPDGGKIAFTSDRNGSGDIYSMAADGSNVIRLTYNGGWSPDWSKTAAGIIPNTKIIENTPQAQLSSTGVSFIAAEYRNTDHGFTVKYPNTWVKHPTPWESDVFKVQDRLITMAFAVSIWKASPYQQLEDYVQAISPAWKAKGYNTEIISHKVTVLSDNVTPALEVVYRATSNSAVAIGFELLVIKNGTFIKTGGYTSPNNFYANESLLREIVYSLEFTK